MIGACWFAVLFACLTEFNLFDFCGLNHVEQECSRVRNQPHDSNSTEVKFESLFRSAFLR